MYFTSINVTIFKGIIISKTLMKRENQFIIIIDIIVIIIVIMNYWSVSKIENTTVMAMKFVMNKSYYL